MEFLANAVSALEAKREAEKPMRAAPCTSEGKQAMMRESVSSAPREVYWHVYIPYEVYVDVCKYMTDTGYKRSIGDLTGVILRDWLVESRRTTDAGGQPKRPITAGYQWKRLFLPEGTMLRTVSRHRSYVAQIQGDQLLYEGTPMTPTGFANIHGGARRNAWKNLWLLFPAEHEWKLADDCRPSRPRRNPTT